MSEPSASGGVASPPPLAISPSLAAPLEVGVSQDGGGEFRGPVPRPPQDDEELSYQLIPPYFSKLETRMPGTVTHLDRDNGGRLLRTFVLLGPLATALRWFKPVLCFGAWELGGGRGEVLMACAMRDGSGQTQLLAWGTATMEGAEQWEWFVANLNRGLLAAAADDDGGDHSHPARRPTTMISDGGAEIDEALAWHFPDSPHVRCMRHIIEEEIGKVFPPREATRAAMWRACMAPSRPEWRRHMQTVLEEEEQVHRHLLDIPPELWATSHATGARWGEICGETGIWMRELLSGSVLRLHAGLVAHCMHQVSNRHRWYSSMTTDLPGVIQDRLDAVTAEGRTLGPVLNGPPGLFLVTDEGRGSEYEVNVGPSQPRCTCKGYDQTRFPCSHMAAAFFSPHGPGDPDAFKRLVDPVYRTEAHRAAYSGRIIPCAVDGDLEPDGETLPPAKPSPAAAGGLIRDPAGAPSKRRRTAMATATVEQSDDDDGNDNDDKSRFLKMLIPL
jgi:hypothetical protein